MLDDINYVTVFVVISVLILWYFIPRRPDNVPPGPSEFPFVGNVPSLISRDTMKSFSALRKRYGDIYGIYIGGEFNVILNGYDVIHEALVKNGHMFSKRPRSEFHQLMFRNQGIVFTNGEIWKESRKFSQFALNEFGYGWTEKSMEERIQEEINHFISRIASFEEPFDMTEFVRLSVANVVAGILFGHRCEYNDPIFVACLQSVSEAAKLCSKSSLLMNCFPALLKLPGDLIGLKKIMKVREKPKEFIRHECMRHKLKSDKQRTNVLDMFTKGVEGSDGTSPLYTERQMHALMAELLSAGSETTATAIIWIVLFIIRNPDLQRRLCKEVDEVIGTERRPNLQDRKNLSLLEATILEGLRIAPVAPLSVPHAVHEDVSFRGYTIPKDTTVLVNLHSVLKDPEVWDDPDRFCPERFLDEDGMIHVPKEHIPFCIGRRACLGESLARMELFLYVASLLQKFELLPADVKKMPAVTGHLGMTYRPSPFKVRLRVR